MTQNYTVTVFEVIGSRLVEMGTFNDLPCPEEDTLYTGESWGNGFHILEVAQIDHEQCYAEIAGMWVDDYEPEPDNDWCQSGINHFDCEECGKANGMRFVENIDGTDCYHCRNCGSFNQVYKDRSRIYIRSM